MTWIEPKSKQAVYVDLFWGENKRGYAREVSEANTTKFSESRPIKVDAKLFLAAADKSIATQLGLIERNINEKSFPAGETVAKYKDSALTRLSGCSWKKKAQDILKLVQNLK